MPYLVELQTAISIHILSKQQVDLLTERARGDSCRIIRHRNRRCRDESRAPCFILTALGFYRSRVCVGWSVSYLLNSDRWRFRKLPRKRLGSFNCITKGGSLYRFRSPQSAHSNCNCDFANHKLSASYGRPSWNASGETGRSDNCRDNL
jgi:hypothetical protein